MRWMSEVPGFSQLGGCGSVLCADAIAFLVRRLDDVPGAPHGVDAGGDLAEQGAGRKACSEPLLVGG